MKRQNESTDEPFPFEVQGVDVAYLRVSNKPVLQWPLRIKSLTVEQWLPGTAIAKNQGQLYIDRAGYSYIIANQKKLTGQACTDACTCNRLASDTAFRSVGC